MDCNVDGDGNDPKNVKLDVFRFVRRVKTKLALPRLAALIVYLSDQSTSNCHVKNSSSKRRIEKKRIVSARGKLFLSCYETMD